MERGFLLYFFLFISSSRRHRRRLRYLFVHDFFRIICVYICCFFALFFSSYFCSVPYIILIIFSAFLSQYAETAMLFNEYGSSYRIKARFNETES